MKTSIEKLIEDCALRDYGVELTISEDSFVDGVSYFRYSYNSVSYKYNSTHLNIDIIVKDIMRILSEREIPSFKMKIQEYDMLRVVAYSVFTEKFGHCSWALGATWYNPFEEMYELEVIIQGKKLNYFHKGSIKSVEHRTIGNFYMQKYPEYII